MGLDNGIVLKTKNSIIEKPDWVKFDGSPAEHDDGFLEYDICYWRKCWNIRGAIFDIFEKVDKREWEFELSINQVVAIRDRIYRFLTEGEDWDESGESIWLFEEIIPVLTQDILNLSWLIEYMKKDVHAIVYFYDSY